MDPRAERIYTAADYVKSQLGDLRPKVGIVLGSGLGKLAESISNPITIPYRTIPGFPVSTAIGHKGNFIVGELGGKTVIAMQGRIHYYEGYPMELVTLPIRVMKVIGIEYLFVSNAAGGVNFDYHVGDLMIIKDHINQLPNPLIGPNLDDFGPRFPDMTRPYDLKLIAKAEEIGARLGISLHKGVYYGGTGPTYETPSEYKYIRTIGGDATGMSTIPEVIVARHSDIPVFGMSVITNEAHDDYSEDYENNGDDVVKAADAAADRMCAIFTELIKSL
ncbi:MAG: purine-nucleoside phosphorylase [Bacteroidales bacterium]|uniref:purine-nucleoside phosphorylase n=1 Tax=Candidatus Cryptobacteroides sp. TaxID=2952915 RepID=UPI002A744999|nr:purine-nucleoside phosphorylase [Candidatus Cryptobacteroides sp.]MBS7278093.1 purine-nucleoside phosphorylase [Bacteroidales bacterium]MCI6526282.1 purine-nucleoside phosphorylase [Bacteroidales bacterium]MDD5915260.1 purine-nucleoside phosphorylase [Bacteroidales bacterium]MDD6829940.1 purine-nucleoside phosphorylase [Bacteroidales bacterium]MDD7136183.1 purine-nucleoside phosphorylase [Bacteroidales bacterium]